MTLPIIGAKILRRRFDTLNIIGSRLLYNHISITVAMVGLRKELECWIATVDRFGGLARLSEILRASLDNTMNVDISMSLTDDILSETPEEGYNKSINIKRCTFCNSYRDCDDCKLNKRFGGPCSENNWQLIHHNSLNLMRSLNDMTDRIVMYTVQCARELEKVELLLIESQLWL